MTNEEDKDAAPNTKINSSSLEDHWAKKPDAKSVLKNIDSLLYLFAAKESLISVKLRK